MERVRAKILDHDVGRITQLQHEFARATAWSSKLPISDLKSFWGALGCACWAV
jgi:hypothetical protein